MSKIIIKWNTFSYFLTSALSLTQQVIFTYYLTTYSPILWSLLAIDILSTIYILYNSTPRRLVIRGVKCWVTHTRILILKVIFIYLFILPTGITNKHLLLRGYFSFGCELSLVNSITVFIYVLWVFHVGTIIYNGIRKISIEYMLHIELVLRVMIDLLDITDAVHNFLFHQNVKLLGNFILLGYVISLYLHGYSFPCMGLEKYLNSPNSHINLTSSSDDSNSSGDVRYCIKNAIIVGAILDILLGSCRIAAIYITNKIGFSIFLIKNIYSMVLYFVIFTSITIIPKLLKTKEFIHDNKPDTKYDLIKSLAMKSQLSSKSKHFDRIASQNYLWTSKKTDTNYFNKPDMFLGPSLFEYLYKLISGFGLSFKTDLHHYLNPTCLKMDYKFRIIFPYISFMFIEIFSVFIFSFSISNINTKIDFITSYFTRDFTNITKGLKIYGHLIIAFISIIFLINFICFITIVPIIESIFAGLLACVRFLSFIALLSLFAQSNILNMIINNLNPSIVESIGKHIICIFAFIPCINLLSNMYTFISSILGKQYASYVILSMDSFCDAQNQVGVIPTNTLILLITAQNMLLPKSMYKYFTGNYIISTNRLNTMLSWVHTRRIFISMYIRLLLLLSVENPNYYIYLPIFGIHFLFLLVYLFSTQVECFAIVNTAETQIFLQSSYDDMDSDEINGDLYNSNKITNTCKILPNLLF